MRLDISYELSGCTENEDRCQRHRFVGSCKVVFVL